MLFSQIEKFLYYYKILCNNETSQKRKGKRIAVVDRKKESTDSFSHQYIAVAIYVGLIVHAI